VSGTQFATRAPMYRFCVNVRRRSIRTVSALLGAFGLFAAGCHDVADSTNVDIDGMSGGHAGTGGTSAVGGSSGGTANQDCTTLRSYPNCGSPCSMTIERHCVAASPRPCALDLAKICTRYAFDTKWQRGCGYVRVEDYGDVGDHWINVWDESTGHLVYYWSSGKLESGCLPETSAGVEPMCNDWVDACVDGGI